MPRSAAERGHAATQHHLRTYLIAVAADADTAMHYDIDPRANSRPEPLQSPPQDLTSRPSPASVQQGDPSARSNQIHRHAVGDRHRQENSRRGGDPPVDPLDLNPAATSIDAHDLDAMDLVAEDDRLKAGHCSTKGQPAAHHLTNRFRAPKTEIKPTAGAFTSAGNPGDYPVVVSPTGDLVEREGRSGRSFRNCSRASTDLPASPLTRFPASTHPPARSRHRGRAAARRCARTLARSGQRCGSCWSPPPRERQGASPSRRECRATPPCRP
jgi:hypothetical protein